ncbi:MAG TPA: hypothetical protein DDX98_04045 [Bacteroidales bacterium]|jgi:2-polyprenyl-3-methyl-5-hydroxy-6-metoxy-1,4-benzoquinol methylase|nr:hypothetical protein [Bacteroidales bacterium]
MMYSTEKFWDNIAQKGAGQDVRISDSLMEVVKNIRKYLSKDHKILDFACGSGTLCAELADRVENIVAIDISSVMLENAKKKAELYNINNISFQHKSIFDESFKHETFDGIMAFNVLHLLENADEVLRRIHQLLKPGGYFISKTPCIAEKTLLNWMLPFIQKIKKVPFIKRFKMDELESFVIQNGFEKAESKIINHKSASYYLVTFKNNAV